MKISVVIPVYGCKGALNELYERLINVLKKITDDYEIVLVNDNCPQDSWEIIEILCKKDKNVKGINLSRNFGQIKAITAGLDSCCGEWVVVMDCDLQDRPEEILNLYNKAKEGYDIVFAHRIKRKDSFLKILLSKLFYSVYSFATDGYYDPDLCNFSISRKIVIENYCKMREQHRAFVIYLKWLGFKQTQIDIEQDSRKEGKSSYNFKKRFKLACEILTSQSDKLLKVTAGTGFGMIVISIFVLCWIIVNYFTNHVLAGWSSIIASIFLVGGIITMSIGILGIYIGNIFIQVKERPLYVIKDRLNLNNDK